MAGDPIIEVAFARQADEIRASWQHKLLRAALVVDGQGLARPVDLTGAAVLSVLAHNFDQPMQLMLRVAFPDFQAIGVPFFCTAARIARSGNVIADLITKTGERAGNQRIFRSTRDMEGQFRRLADRCRLHGRERIEFFAAVTNWVVADYRLDPNMDRRDPDARRLH